MATKPTIVNIASGSHYDATDLNSRFNTLADWFETVLGLDGVGGSPNSMTGTLDMDSNRIQNLGAPTAVGDAARLQDIVDASDLDSGLLSLRAELGSVVDPSGASLIGVWDTAGHYTATDVEAALAEVAAGIDSHEADTETHGTTGDIVGEDDVQTLTNKTLTTPTIGDFTNATHPHGDAAGGGTLFQGALVGLSGNFAIPDSALTVIDFDQETYDTDGWHEGVTNPERLTVPSGVSYVKVSARLDLTASAATSIIFKIKKNGGSAYSGFTGIYVPNNSGVLMNLVINSPTLAVSAGDYFSVEVYQDSGGPENAQGNATNSATWFAIEKVP